MLVNSTACPAMPVGHDVHRTHRAECLTDEAPTDRRPRQVRKRVNALRDAVDKPAAAIVGIAA